MKQTYRLDCVSWEITLRCNLRCFHCEFSAGKPAPDELTTEEALSLCDDLAKIGCKRVILMGGEVFLRKDWYHIAEKIKQLHMEVAFITNGYLLNDRLIGQLQHLQPAFVGVSVDGGTAETHDKIRGVTGSFDRAFRFVDRCIDTHLPVIIITSVHKLNIAELPLLRDILITKDIFRWEIQITDVEGRFSKDYLVDEHEFYEVGNFIARTQKEYPRLKQVVSGAHDMGYNSSILPELTGFPTWTGCPAGKTMMAIESNGGVKGCSAQTGHFVEDNIRNRGVIEIWNDPHSFAYNRQFTKQDLHGYCRQCIYGETCKGGCVETSYMLTGSTHGNPYCFHRIEEKTRKRNRKEEPSD
ncbi:MAG: radical SAM protein [Candidatus Thermoplasmatota archaeon]|nr:radical SAM protein [Candidatus Thermoplasmatota archaeon]